MNRCSLTENKIGLNKIKSIHQWFNKQPEINITHMKKDNIIQISYPVYSQFPVCNKNYQTYAGKKQPRR